LVFIKGGTFFIPGSLGAQDSGNVLLLRPVGYSNVTGVTFVLLRRFRELAWIGIGLLCLAMMDRGHRSLRDGDAQDQPHDLSAEKVLTVPPSLMSPSTC
jgi:hypothetical protein